MGKRDRIMTKAPETRNDPSSCSQVQHLKVICDRFAAACQAEPPPRIEDCLAEVAQTERAVLLRQLLVLEFADRSQKGETVLLQEYCRRFPADAELIHAAFREAAGVPS